MVQSTEIKPNISSTNIVFNGTQFDHPEELPFPVELT